MSLRALRNVCYTGVATMAKRNWKNSFVFREMTWQNFVEWWFLLVHCILKSWILSVFREGRVQNSEKPILQHSCRISFTVWKTYLSTLSSTGTHFLSFLTVWNAYIFKNATFCSVFHKIDIFSYFTVLVLCDTGVQSGVYPIVVHYYCGDQSVKVSL